MTFAFAIGILGLPLATPRGMILLYFFILSFSLSLSLSLSLRDMYVQYDTGTMYFYRRRQIN